MRKQPRCDQCSLMTQRDASKGLEKERPLCVKVLKGKNKDCEVQGFTLEAEKQTELPNSPAAYISSPVYLERLGAVGFFFFFFFNLQGDSLGKHLKGKSLNPG